jgi:hypothetical protein
MKIMPSVAIDAKIALLRKHQLVGGVTGEDLELVLGGNLRDRNHCVIDDVADGLPAVTAVGWT